MFAVRLHVFVHGKRSELKAIGLQSEYVPSTWYKSLISKLFRYISYNRWKQIERGAEPTKRFCAISIICQSLITKNEMGNKGKEKRKRRKLSHPLFG